MTSLLTTVAGGLVVASLVRVGAQAPPPIPVLDVRVPVSPRPLVGGGGVHLAYELHVANFGSQSLTLDAVEVRERGAASANAPALLRLEGDALTQAIRRAGVPPSERDSRVLPAGRMAVVFVWLPLRGRATPEGLTHRFTVRLASGAASSGDRPVADAPTTISGVDVRVVKEMPRVIGPPLEGDHWLAGNGPDNGTGHRRALLSVAAQVRVPQRFAIDWVRLFEDGRTSHGDPKNNGSYRAFGARVLAVADSTVIETVDGIPENVPDPVARAVPITPATLSGNSIVLDIGAGAYAVYAHLQPGSLTVKKGERVRRGQVLGLVGNTGNSTEPHLHFHMADRPYAIDAEGIPYAFASFGLEAAGDAVTAAVNPAAENVQVGASALALLKAPVQRRENEIPLLNAIVTFADR